MTAEKVYEFILMQNDGSGNKQSLAIRLSQIIGFAVWESRGADIMFTTAGPFTLCPNSKSNETLKEYWVKANGYHV